MIRKDAEHQRLLRDQLPRIPAVGLEPGAIRGTMPHRSRLPIKDAVGNGLAGGVLARALGRRGRDEV